MKALMLGACLAAVLGAPAFAQPYDRDQGGYQDPRDPYYDQGQTGDQDDRYQNDRGYDDNDRGYQDDRGYDTDNRAYDQDRDYDRGEQGQRGYGGVPPGARFTGRTGASWRNSEGQTCTWRELSWQDDSGNPAYKWIPRCR